MHRNHHYYDARDAGDVTQLSMGGITTTTTTIITTDA